MVSSMSSSIAFSSFFREYLIIVSIIIVNNTVDISIIRIRSIFDLARMIPAKAGDINNLELDASCKSPLALS